MDVVSEVVYRRNSGAYMRAGVETLCTVASVEEERFALLDLGELVP